MTLVGKSRAVIRSSDSMSRNLSNPLIYFWIELNQFVKIVSDASSSNVKVKKS